MAMADREQRSLIRYAAVPSQQQYRCALVLSLLTIIRYTHNKMSYAHLYVAEGNIYTGIEDTCIIPVRSTGIVYDRRSYTKIVHTEGMYLVYIPKVCILYNSVAIIL